MCQHITKIADIVFSIAPRAVKHWCKVGAGNVSSHCIHQCCRNKVYVLKEKNLYITISVEYLIIYYNIYSQIEGQSGLLSQPLTIFYEREEPKLKCAIIQTLSRKEQQL